MSKDPIKIEAFISKQLRQYSSKEFHTQNIWK